jgi:putative endonuclease
MIFPGSRVRGSQLSLGAWGEKAAVIYLKQQKMTILRESYRTRWGEIDIVARDAQTLVFCEVKTRSSTHKGHPLEAVTPAKQKQIVRVAARFLKDFQVRGVSIRFDVIGILADDRLKPEILHIKGAFTAPPGLN